MLALALSACAGATPEPPAAPVKPTSPSFEVRPLDALIDEPVFLQVEGLRAGEQVTLRARMERGKSGVWSSSATFTADPDGVVDLARQAPDAGSYEGVDAMGLMWSMTPEAEDWERGLFEEPPLAALTVVVSVERDGVELATRTLIRRRVAEAVVRRDLRADGLYGTLFLPPEATGAPAVLVLGGSEGGLREGTAALLASRGFAALALAYFAADGLPPTLQNIPLEYFESALMWMKAQPEIDGARIAVQGISRGGELALLLGATFPDIRAVVAHVPSGVVWQGIGMAQAPAWTRGGEPVPFLSWPLDPALQAQWMQKLQAGEPISMAPMFQAAMDQPEAMAAAAIAVERIQGPVLLVSGKADALWPSTALAELAAERLRAHGRPYEHLAFDDAGHLIVPPYLPTTISALTHPALSMKIAFGGTPAGNARACAEAWRRMLSFLGESLRPQ